MCIILLFYITLCFSLFFPIMGACCAQIKGFTLGCRELVLVRPNVKSFICAQHAPISGLWIKVFVKALPNQISPINSCLAVSLPDNICIPNAQYSSFSAQQNLWCEILEF